MTQTLADLEARIQALERQVPSEQLVPGVFSLNAAGELEEKLSGKLEAKGIVFQEFNLLGKGPEELSLIEWQEEGTGTPRESIVGEQEGGRHELNLNTKGPASGAHLTLRASTLQGELRALAEHGPELGEALIINNAGQSSFLQLATLANHKIAFGTATFKYGAGKSHATELLSIATGLAAITSAWFCPTTSVAASVSIETFEAGTIKAKLYTPLNEFETPTAIEARWIAVE